MNAKHFHSIQSSSYFRIFHRDDLRGQKRFTNPKKTACRLASLAMPATKHLSSLLAQDKVLL
ncbi:MAG: hypothetical protein K5683_06450 [Prevotella sp.]|nr:hypothetical protein [Prevotella sp.]